MYNEKKELEQFQSEKQILDLKTDNYKNSIVESITKQKLGDDIRKTLSNPIVITRFQLFKIKFKNLIKSIFDVL